MGGPDVLDARLEAVAVPRRDFASHGFRPFSAQGAPDGLGDGSRALDALGVVVRDFRDAVACRERVFKRLFPVEESHRRHAHRCAVPEAAVGPRYGTSDPFPEESSVSAPGVAPAPGLKRRGRFAVVQDDVGDSGGADGVVRVRAQAVEELEVLRVAPAALEP